MMSLKLAILLLTVFVACSKGQGGGRCRSARRGIEVGGCQVYDSSTGEMVIYTEDNKADCEAHEGCCWDGNSCTNIERGSGQSSGEGENPFNPPATEARFFGVKPPPICYPVPNFPHDCKYAKNEPYVVVPPVDVPYCVRVPCSLDVALQKSLDKSHFGCGSQPGCYFDVELYDYRESFGPAVLAGVPVCHLAIRRSVFLREAQKAIDEVGKWNPYYTNCLLKTFDEEIREQPPGCKLINILKIFKINPKLAGWGGITSYECILIDGCWRPKEGCVYPVNVDNIVVKSNQRFHFNRFEVTYGRPKCQHWNNDNAWEFLRSYHKCLASGCSVDANVANVYYNKLFEIGGQMESKDHWEYWKQVEGGKIGSHNIEDGVYWPFDRSFGGKGSRPSTPEPPKPDPSNPFAPPPSGGVSPGASSPFGFGPPPAPSGGGGAFQPPGPVVAPSRERCGEQWQQYGYRPCPPPSPPPYKPSQWCPYKPFVVPRFKPLKGSFRGCCDVNPCYISRRDIRKLHSGPSYYYTEWSLFSLCSTTCGPGVQKRVRRCVSHDEKLCTEKTEQVRSCNDGPCGRWGPWRPWSPPCEYQFQLQSRKRFCLPQGAKCGVNQETEEEENQYCPA